MELFVGNFVYNTTELELWELFAMQGSVVNVRIIHDQFTRQSKCFGYVKMLTKKGAEKAIDALDEKMINANKLVVRSSKICFFT